MIKGKIDKLGVDLSLDRWRSREMSTSIVTVLVIIKTILYFNAEINVICKIVTLKIITVQHILSGVLFTVFLGRRQFGLCNFGQNETNVKLYL
jgi:hypothetical protein